MTEAQRQAIREALAKRTSEATSSPQAARDFLVRKGYYDEKGEPAARFQKLKAAG